MSLWRLAWRNVWGRPLSAALTILLFATGTGLMVALLLVQQQVEERFTKNLAGVDMVVGAKGSPLQLILSSLYHIDYPTGNITLGQTQFLSKNPMVDQCIPISVGDNYKSWRIIGTTEAYPALYEAELAEGNWWQAAMEVTVGARVAKQLNLKVGDTFAGGHSLDIHGQAHDEHPYKVVGVMQSTGTVLDQLLLTSLESYWVVHGHDEPEPAEEDEHDHDHAHDHEGHDHPASEVDQNDQEITALLVTFKAEYAALTIPRQVNEDTNLQAASPTIESARLVSVAGAGTDGLTYLAMVVLVLSGLSVFIALLNAMKERRYEISVLRVMGGSRSWLLGMVWLEATWIGVLGILAGLLLGHIGTSILAGVFEGAYRYEFSGWVWSNDEWWLVLGSIGGAWLAAVLPALLAYNSDISKTLSNP